MLSFGGKGNAAAVLDVALRVGLRSAWRNHFANFENPYSFYSADEYRPWVTEAGFTVSRVELVPKDMTHHGAEGLSGWLRTTWMPLSSRIPEPDREQFLQQVIAAYIEEHPIDAAGNVHVHMVRLEVEATKQ